MKQRFSSLDVKVICCELSAALVGLRIANIYDLSSRIFLFKLQKPDVRKQIVVDAGLRCHLTEYSRTTAPAPSHFVSRLRQYLKSRRITAITQVGTDRIIHIEFSDGQFHLFLEFFAAGNIILTDNEYKIISLFRVVAEGEEQDEVRIGLLYRLEDKQNYGGIPPLTVERLKNALETAKNKGAAQPEATTKKSKKKQGEALRRALSVGFPEYPPLVLEHALHVTGFDPSLPLDQILESDERISDLMHVLQEAENVSASLSTTGSNPGYIISRNKGISSEAPNSGADPKANYIDYQPFEPKQFADNSETFILSFESFNKAVDEFYSSVEAQKLESRLTEREETMKRKLEATKRDHEKRVGALKEVQELHTRKAQAIEANLSTVEETINAVNSLIAQGMDWVEIARLIEMEQSRQNPIAKVIKLPLKLYENTITVQLSEQADEDDESEEEDEDESDFESQKKPNKSEVLSIDIDLALSPWANARQYYDQKKTAALKEDKTIKASKKALKSAEKKVTADLKQGLKQEKPVLRPARVPFWFEKFFFFVSSDGYLVLGGQDARQDEMLYHRHLQRGDIYVHTDAADAMPMIIKNKPGATDAPIPPSTLAQAGTFTVASSRAWDNKGLMGAWWVAAEQVSRTTPAGEYMATGVIVNGQKNHLPPSQLILGFAVLFQISPESVANHTKHRTDEADLAYIPRSSNEAQQMLQPIERELQDAQRNRDGGHSETRIGETDEASGCAVHKGEQSIVKEPIISAQNETPVDTSPPGNGERYMPGPEPQGTSDLSEIVTQPEEGGSLTGEPKSQESDEDEWTENTSQPSRTQTPSIQPFATSKSQPQVRGKRGKAKKLATKYKDQDEEDRQLALRLLGSAPKEALVKKTREDRDAEIQAQKERRRAQHNKGAQAERQRQENLKNQQKGLSAKDMDQKADDLSCLPMLIGTPLAGDEIISAIPVCAPWLALSQCKYRAKLQPGPTGKGKIVKEILGKWIVGASSAVKKQASAPAPISADGNENKLGEEGPGSKGDEETSLTATELDLLKGWRETEIVNIIPTGKIRIVSVAGAGGSVSATDDSKGKGKKPGGGPGKGGKGSSKGGKKR